jgi:hypothetical protein
MAVHRVVADECDRAIGQEVLDQEAGDGAAEGEPGPGGAGHPDLLFPDLGDAATLAKAAPRLAGKARRLVALHCDGPDDAAEALARGGAFRVRERWEHGGVLVVLAWGEAVAAE